MEIADRLIFDALSLKDIPLKERKFGVCLWYVSRNGRELRHVPQHHRTVHMVTLAAGTYAKAYLMANMKVRENRDLTLLAVRRGGLKVWLGVPVALIDTELCLAAVKGCGSILGYIPLPFRCSDVCRAACVAGGVKIEDIPAEYLSEAFFEGVALPNIPPMYRNKKHCLVGVQLKGNYLKYVPARVLCFRILKVALRNDAWAVRYVDEPFRANRFYKLARRKVAKLGVDDET